MMNHSSAWIVAVFTGITVMNLSVEARGDDAGQFAGPDLRVGQLRVGKVLFLGNSITLHGPAPKIGWDGNWGMAASTREKDFVHVLLSRIAKSAGGKPEVKIKNIADFERSSMASI